MLQAHQLPRGASVRGLRRGARRDLSRAFDRVKDPKVRVDLLFKLAQVYTRLDLWPKVMGCWERIVQEDPQNIKARHALLETRYLQAESQARVGSVETCDGTLLCVADGATGTRCSAGGADGGGGGG